MLACVQSARSSFQTLDGRTKSEVAFAHHWLVNMRGGERVLEQMALNFPASPIYTLVAQPTHLSESLRSHPIHTSPLQAWPGATRHYPKLLPLYPWAVRSLRVPDSIRLLISSDASVIKGIPLPPHTRHACMCYSPPRYLYDLQGEYAAKLGAAARLVFQFSVPHVRRFDQTMADRVDAFAADSRFVADRIQRYYGRQSTVIYPPVDWEAFDDTRTRDQFYLIVSQLTPYKRVDLAVRACTRMNKQLIVIGEGSEMDSLRSMAGPTVRLLGKQPFSVLKEHYETCRAFFYPQIEDFGITALEAQAAGAPVIAYKAGGALETVVDGQTGLFFEHQTVDDLCAAIERFEETGKKWEPATCRTQAAKFRHEIFQNNFRAFLRTHFPDEAKSITERELA